jgi:hypothetical protein
MFRFPDLSPIQTSPLGSRVPAPITIQGPFWTAQATVLKMAPGPAPLPLGGFQPFDIVPRPGPVPRFQFAPSTGNPLQPDSSGGSQTTLKASADTATHFAEFTAAGSSALTSYTYSGRIRVSDQNANIGLTVLSGIGQGNQTVRVLRCVPNIGISLAHFTADNQTTTIDKTVSNVFSANQSFRFVIQVVAGANNASTLHAQIFPEGTTAPSATNLNLTAGEVGSVGLMWSGPGDKFFSDLQVQFDVDPADTQLLRRLFVENAPRTGGGQTNVLSPRTAIAVCSVQSVQIDGQSTLSWSSSANAAPVSEADLQAKLASGDLNVFLLEADPATWLSPASNQGFTCLAGEIDLNNHQIQPTGAARTTLFQKLGLTELATADGVSALSVHSGGLSVEGQAVFPWQSTPAAAAWLLNRILPATPAAARKFHLDIDASRTRQSHRDALTQSWRSLSQLVNPAFPLTRNGPTAPSGLPNWATLEAPNPIALPPVFFEWNGAPWDAGASSVLNIKKGNMNVLLTDQQPYSTAAPPASLARILPDRITIAAATAGLTIAINPPVQPAPSPTPATPGPPELVYSFTPSGETVTLQQITLAYDPTATPKALRAQQSIPAPEWNQAPLDSPLLWAFMPLETGWAQLPVFNLTEQVYLDAKLFHDLPATPAGSSLLQGGVSLGNETATFPSENLWRVNLTDGASVSGTWTWKPVGNSPSMQLDSIDLRIESPHVVVDGLCWLSTGKPTVQDALPDLDNWVSGVTQVSLTTVDTAKDVFPSPMAFAFDKLSFNVRALPQPTPGVDARLAVYQFEYKSNPTVLQNMISAKVLPAAGIFDTNLPLVWRRDPVRPMVQALPMTQNQTPPNYPSASRQLAPFALPVHSDSPAALGLPASWIFSVQDSAQTTAAARFPDIPLTLPAAFDWFSARDLPLASLTVPGMYEHPAAPALPFATQVPEPFLPLGYRFDLPYTDQVNALAEVPKTENGDGVSVPATATPAPLQREDFGIHWQRLQTLAKLAAADAVEALTAAQGATGATLLQNLVEPEQFTIDSPLLNRLTATTAPAIDQALEGHSGQFTSGATTFTVTAGSMEALADNGFFRDQRGLRRKSSTPAPAQSPTLLRTPVALGSGAFDLVSMLQSVSLKIDAGTNWQFWFRDLPVAAGAFSHDAVVSASASDVNDPEARSRDKNFLNGYEWRLGQAVSATPSPFLPLFDLHFYPMSLASVTFTGDAVDSVAIVGRLQLPVPNETELTEFPNAVKLTFKTANNLALDSVDMVSGFGQWPLAASGSEISGSIPRLVWTKGSFDKTNLKLTLNAALRFCLAGVEWSISSPDSLSFPLPSGTDAKVQLTRTITQSVSAPSFSASQLNITLRRTGVHEASLTLHAEIGGVNRAGFAGDVQIDLMASNPLTAAAVSNPLLFGKMSIDSAGAKTQFGPESLQFSWTALPAAAVPPQFLPGMHILGSGAPAPGYATLTYTAQPAAAPATPLADSIPTLAIGTAFIEAVIQCRWGSFLQSRDSQGDFTRVFGSSAGEIAAGYTLQFHDGQVSESFLLNGFLEVKDLISWPAAMQLSPTKLTLPASASQTALNHIRHTVRVLLNQHAISQGLLQRPAQPDVLFSLADGKSWQFLAVVEHQLVQVSIGLALSNDVRWTALQEVRILRPTGDNSMSAFLGALDSDSGKSPGGTVRRGLGYLQPELRQALLDALAALPANTLIVEASAPHWIAVAPAASAATASTLQFLPNGSQHAIPASSQDFDPDLSLKPQWVLITTPFLGRLQPTSADSLPAPGTAVNALTTDPIRRLSAATAPDRITLALTNWADSAAADISVSGFDTRLGRTFGRLDPASLEENLARMQNLPAEPLSQSLSSVMASLPDGPARLSRPQALAQAFSSALPAINDPGSVPGEVSGPAVWRLASLLVNEAAAGLDLAILPPYGWHIVGAQLLGSGLIGRAIQSAPERHAAAAAIPVSLPSGISVVISPYLGLEFRRAPLTSDLKLIDCELLCLDRASGGLLPVADKLFEDVADASDPAILEWAGETQQRLSPESPIAIVRLREVAAAQDASDGSAILIARYAFQLVPVTPAAATLAAPALAIRSAVVDLKFQEAQYGGSSMPSGIATFELAAPQIAGVQPLYRKVEGWSGLRISVVCTQDRKGVVPASGSQTVWWQAPEFAVQFSSGGAGLPATFRAPAISSLRPSLPNPPMPQLNGQLDGATPVLPGETQYFLIGNRAGVPIAIRHHLIRQAASGEVLVSSSVPVQHRVPRPVPLLTAAQLSTQITTNPFDDVFFAGPPAKRLRLTLTKPNLGLIDSTWDGALTFTATSDSATATWDLAGSIRVGNINVELVPAFSQSVSSGVQLAVRGDRKTDLANALSSLRPGDVATLSIRAKPSDSTSGFFQTMSFPLRVRVLNADPLPLGPFFAWFEDPEYNARLASATAQATALIRLDDQQLHPVKLAADRHEYNPDSVVAIRWNFVDSAPLAAPSLTLVVTRKDRAGILTPIAINPENPTERQLVMLPLAGTGVAFAPGDVLQVELQFSPTQKIRVDLSIVAESVLPVPQSAYALLRADTARTHIECVRFAWSPSPDRIELVSPDDLGTDLVRRRAVFHWTDTRRTNTATAQDYRLQKIGADGATHATF